MGLCCSYAVPANCLYRASRPRCLPSVVKFGFDATNNMPQPRFVVWQQYVQDCDVRAKGVEVIVLILHVCRIFLQGGGNDELSPERIESERLTELVEQRGLEMVAADKITNHSERDRRCC